MENASDFMDMTLADSILIWLRANVMDILGAFAVLIIGLFIAGLIQRAVSRALLKSDRFDRTVAQFLANTVKYALWVVVIVTVLTQFGVETTSILAALSGVALAIGLALQGTLSNVAAGVMITVQKPFKVGEAIKVGDVTAVVQDINLFTTELKQFDGLFVMIPNAELWNKPIVNYHRHPTRRFDLVIGIAYSDNMNDARRELLAIAQSDERVLDDPAPVVFVNSLDDSSVGIGLRVWCATSDYLGVTWDLTEKAKARFDEAGITIPFPQREITQYIKEKAA